MTVRILGQPEKGQLPGFALQHDYADCTGPGGVFGSIDYSDDDAEFFVGVENTSALGSSLSNSPAV